MFWNRFPFARILLPFLSGIIIALRFDLTQVIPVYVFFALFLMYSLLIILFQQKLSYRWRWVPGFIIILFFLLAGYQLSILRNSVNIDNHFSKHISGNAVYMCTLLEPVQIKENSCKAFVEITHIHDSAKSYSTSGKALIYLEKDSLSQALTYGDNIMISGHLKQVKPPMNPGEYNYKDYLTRHSVEYSKFITQESWKRISANNGNLILKYAYEFRQKLLCILGSSGVSAKEYSVISALLIGYTDKLDPDLIKDYQGSGAMHILSVSGMHVGVIYLVLNFFLFFFDKFKYGRIPKAIILILFVWGYAILTGLSPAVLRAATMFSFIAIGNAAKYPPNIFNTLGASAFVLLISNPHFLFDVGFQLSYLAVFGIVAIYPYIYKSWWPKYTLLNKIWGLISVSIAAQLATFPLCLFYFHQFPNYFILTNIVAIPLSAIVIYLGIAYLIFYSVPFLSVIIAKALTFSLIALNDSISFIEGLPYSVSQAITITAVEMLLLYLVIITICAFLILKKNKILLAALMLFLILLCSLTTHKVIRSTQKNIIVYQINHHTAVDFIDGNNCYFVTDSLSCNNFRKQAHHIAGSRIQYNIKTIDTLFHNNDSSIFKDNIFYQHQEFIYFAGKKLLIVNKASQCAKRIPVDFVILSNNPKITIDTIIKQFNPELVIMDGSNYSNKTKQWILQCTKRNVPFYATSESGAWIYEFNN